MFTTPHALGIIGIIGPSGGLMPPSGLELPSMALGRHQNALWADNTNDTAGMGCSNLPISQCSGVIPSKNYCNWPYFGVILSSRHCMRRPVSLCISIFHLAPPFITRSCCRPRPSALINMVSRFVALYLATVALKHF